MGFKGVGLKGTGFKGMDKTSSSNSDLQGVRLDGAEAPSDDDGLVSSESVAGQAIAMVARRRLTVVEASGRHVANQRAWLTKTRAGLASEHGDRVRAILALDPGISPEALANRLQPSPEPAKRQESPLDETVRAQRARFTELRRLQQSDGPTSTREQAKAHLAQLRATCRPAGRSR